MAIFSINHKAIGLTTHKPGTAGAHIKYICRASTARKVLNNHLPSSPFSMATWFNHKENELRKNGRVVDKIMVALPIEFDDSQREEVVLDFIESITSNKVPWVVAFHDLDKDSDNPHAHIVIHDRDVESGKPVFRLSEQGSTVRLRKLWADILNEALTDFGYDESVDHRSYAERGIAKKPSIHEGPRARAMLKRGVRPVSRDKVDSKGRLIRYTEIDSGLLRGEYNEGLDE